MRAYFYLLLAMFLWASSFVALKFAFAVYHPMWVIWGRMLIALSIFMFFIRRIRQFNYRKGDIKLLALMSICEPCLYFIFEAEALELTTASQAGMITALLPILVAVLAVFTLKEKTGWNTWAGFALSVCGAVTLSVAGDASEKAPNPLLGNLLEFAAMACAAVYSVTLKKLSERYSALTLTSLQAMVGSVFFFPLAMFAPAPGEFSALAVGSVFYLGAAVTLGAYYLYNLAITQVSVTQASGFINLIPVFTLLLAFVLLGERLNQMQWMACILVLMGVFLSQLRFKSKACAVQPTES